jgi:hypothetical protein
VFIVMESQIDNEIMFKCLLENGLRISSDLFITRPLEQVHGALPEWREVGPRSLESFVAEDFRTPQSLGGRDQGCRWGYASLFVDHPFTEMTCVFQPLSFLLISFLDVSLSSSFRSQIKFLR